MSNQFDVMHRHLKELGITNYNYLYQLWELIKSGGTRLSGIYQQYLQETREELWDSPEAIYRYFDREKNYNKLLNGLMGDNLLRKYKTRMLVGQCCSAIELAYSVLEKMAASLITKEIHQSLAAAKQWMFGLRNLRAVFKSKLYVEAKENLYLPYDVSAWYLDGSDARPLTDYKKPVAYQLFCDSERIKRTLSEIKELWGGDLFFQVGKLLINFDIKDFWRQCEPLAR
jgi:hypothetical protein